VIKNHRQYCHTKKQAANFREALAKAKITAPGDDVHPKMYAAYLDGLAGELETLETELAEYDSLARGNTDTIELDRLDKLPSGLIKARIARGLSHKQLGEKLKVKPQQIQRWEFDEYENVGFRRLVEIAAALEVYVAETIYLPRKQQSVISALKELGIDRQFLLTRLVPRRATESVMDHVLSAAERLSKIFGIELLADGTLINPREFIPAAAALRFKLPSNAESQRVRAYAAYVSHLAGLVVSAAQNQETLAVPNEWSAMRHHLFGDGPVDFANAVSRVWELGIPVLPLSDPVRMHGCCLRIKGRNVIVLKQSIRYTSRWLFDLVHELHHAAEQPEELTFAKCNEDPTRFERRESDDEVAANEFAGNVLLNGYANELYEAVLQQAQYQISKLKSATVCVSESSNEDVGILANYVAFRLKADHFVDWWGAAANLQAEDDDAVGVTRQIFLSRFPFDLLSDNDRELLEQALTDPSL
jgi:transcriptional regulator with XRE-family HTH domain